MARQTTKQLLVDRLRAKLDAVPETRHMAVPDEILRQLGGRRRFSVMTGAKDYLGSSNALSFVLPRCKDGINAFRITLGSDLYLLEGLRINSRAAVRVRTVASEDHIFGDQLRASFTRLTGLETSGSAA